VLVLLLVLLAVFAPLLAGDPLAQNLAERLQPPSARAPVRHRSAGAGRLRPRLWARASRSAIGFLVVALSLTVGAAVGLVASTLGGVWDDLLMRLTDIFLAFPALILAMAISAALGPNLTNVMIAVAGGVVATYARLMRGTGPEPAGARVRRGGEGARAAQGRVAWRHLLPNSVAPLCAGELRRGRGHPDGGGARALSVSARSPRRRSGARCFRDAQLISEAPMGPRPPGAGDSSHRFSVQSARRRRPGRARPAR
jgi:peptide/nickel transport system permease protein